MAPTSSPPNIAPKQTGYWLVLAVSTVLFACGGDATETAPVPDIQLDEDTTSAPENAAGIPGATTSLLPSPAQWLIADAKDRVWTLLEDGRLGRLSGTSFEEVCVK